MARANCRFCGHYQEIIDDVIMGECLRCRDRFAMAALSGYLSGTFIDQAVNDGEYTGDPNIELTARDCYRFADAMLTARKTPGASTPPVTPKETT